MLFRCGGGGTLIEFDLSLSNLVNAAGAALFVAVGAFALVVGRRSTRARLVGVAALALGVLLVLSNLFVFDRLVTLSQTVGGVAAAALIGPLALHLVADLPARDRRLFAALAGVMTAGLAVSAVVSLRDPAPLLRLVPTLDDPSLVAFNLLAFGLFGSSLVLVAVAAGVRSRALPADASGERRACALLALAFGSYPLFYGAPVHGVLVQLAPMWVGNVLASFVWVGAAPPGDGAPARRAALLLQASALAGMLFWGPVSAITENPGFVDHGIPGVLRTAGAFLLLMAILRHDLLRVPLPHVSVRRGPLAATALALLLIVAQVAQNFLSAQYSLVMGGVVSGALVFAARPIERALEGRRDATAPRAATDDRARRVYRDAVRHALRDRAMTRAEEVHLTELAEELGLPASEALRIRHEVEDERG